MAERALAVPTLAPEAGRAFNRRLVPRTCLPSDKQTTLKGAKAPRQRELVGPYYIGGIADEATVALHLQEGDSPPSSFGDGEDRTKVTHLAAAHDCDSICSLRPGCTTISANCKGRLSFELEPARPEHEVPAWPDLPAASTSLAGLLRVTKLIVCASLSLKMSSPRELTTTELGRFT
eukprot:3172032-Prymnesium_polylepis.1